MGNHLFLFILSLSLSGTLIGLLLLALRPVTKKYLSKKWNYYIWLIVVARLILPIHFETNLVNDVFSVLGANQTVPNAEAESDAYEALTENMQGAVGEAESAEIDIIAGADANMQKKETVKPAVSTEGQLFFPYLSLIWFFGMLLSFFIKVNDYRNFKAYIMADCRKVTDEKITVLLEKVRKNLKVGEHVSLYTNPLAASPAIIGIREPFVILPENGIDEKQLPFVLHHELIHLKRKDLWYKWLFQLVLCIHWFNPFLYLFNKKLNMDCELSCDEKVVSMLEEQERRIYGNVLLDAAELKNRYKNNVLSTTLVEDKKNLKERLSGIIHYKKETPVLLLISLGIFAAVGIFAVIAGVATGTESVEQKQDGQGFLQSLFSEINKNFSDIDDLGVNSFLAASHPNEFSEAWEVYDDDEELAGEDIREEWRAYRYSGNGEKGVEAKGLALNGSDTLLILYAKKDIEINVETSFSEVSGRFKLIMVGPEEEVAVISESGEKSNTQILLKKGRNVIKMAGQGAKLKKLHIAFSGIKNADFDNIYYSQEEEYAYETLNSFRTEGSVNLERLEESLPFLKDREVSLYLKKLLEADVQLSKDMWVSLITYSDNKLSGLYIREAIENGTMKPLQGDVFKEICPYLDEETGTALLLNMDKETLTFQLLRDAFPYLSEEGRTETVLYYLDSGNTLTYSQFADLAAYLSEKAIKKIDEKINSLK